MRYSIHLFSIKALLHLNNPYSNIRTWWWLFRMATTNDDYLRMDEEEFEKLLYLRKSKYMFEGPLGKLMLRIGREYGLTKEDMSNALYEGYTEGVSDKTNE